MLQGRTQKFGLLRMLDSVRDRLAHVLSELEPLDDRDGLCAEAVRDDIREVDKLVMTVAQQLGDAGSWIAKICDSGIKDYAARDDVSDMKDWLVQTFTDVDLRVADGHHLLREVSLQRTT